MGPAILARAGDRPLRRQDPRLRARVHGQTAPALPALRPRGDGGRPRCPDRLRPHRRVALGGPAESAAGEDRSGPRRRHGVPAAGGGDGEGRATASPSGSAPAAASPLVVFVGKLIVSKGVDLLLAAWPLVRASIPRRGSRSPASAPTRTGCAGCSPPSTPATSTTRARSRGSAAASRAGSESRCRSSAPSSTSRRRATPTPPAAPPARSSSSAGSSTTRSPSCCRTPRRW